MTLPEYKSMPLVVLDAMSIHGVPPHWVIWGWTPGGHLLFIKFNTVIGALLGAQPYYRREFLNSHQWPLTELESALARATEDQNLTGLQLWEGLNEYDWLQMLSQLQVKA